MLEVCQSQGYICLERDGRKRAVKKSFTQETDLAYDSRYFSKVPLLRYTMMSPTADLLGAWDLDLRQDNRSLFCRVRFVFLFLLSFSVVTKMDRIPTCSRLLSSRLLRLEIQSKDICRKVE